MPGLQLNFTGVQASAPMEPVPAGTYQVSVRGLKQKMSSTNKPMLEWVFEIEDGGQHNGHRIFTNTILEAKSLWRTKDFLLALGYTEEELAADFELDPAEIVGMMANAIVTVKEYQGSKRNEIARLAPWVPSSESTTPAWAEMGEGAEEDVQFYAEAGFVVDESASTDEPVGDDDDEASDAFGSDDGLEDDEPEPEAYVIPENVKISSTARKLAEEHQVPLDQITPTGPGKTYTQKDIQGWIDSSEA